MCPWVGSHASSFGRQLWGLPSRIEYLSQQGVLLPRVYSTTVSPLWLELQGPHAWHATPSWAVCPHACHQLLPWRRATFAMVLNADLPGSDQRPWSSAPATGLVGWLRRPSASDPRCVGCGALSLCCPPCMCVCGVLADMAPVHRCARCLRCVCAVSGFVPLPPPPQFSFLSFFSFCICFFFVPFFLILIGKRGRAYTAGTWNGNWCSGGIVLCSLECVAGALVLAAPQGCGSRVLIYMGTGQVWCWLVRRLCALWVWVVFTLLPQRAWLGVKGWRLRGAVWVRLVLGLWLG